MEKKRQVLSMLGVDAGRQVVYLENTLRQDGSSYWAVDFQTFLQAWQYPEIRATDIPARHNPSIQAEKVTQWAMVIEK